MQKNIVIIVSSVLVVATLFFVYSPKEAVYRGQDRPEKNLIVGTNSEFPPFEYLEDGLLVGFEIDVIRRIAERLGKTVIFKDLPFDALIPEIQTGSIHMIAAGMTPTPEREKRVYFTKPILEKNPLVIVTLVTNNKITGVDELKGKTVAVNEGYFADKYLSEFSDIIIMRIASASIGEAFVSLKSQRADALVTSLASIKPFLENYADLVHVSYIPGTDEIAALVVAHQYPELLKSVNIIIEQMKEDKTLDVLREKWLGK